MSETTLTTIRGFAMTGRGEPLRECGRAVPHLEAGEVLIEVAGCGVCHTDLGFYYGGVATRGALPLVLGHEISGWVADAGSAHRGLIGRAVIVPAVVPCGACDHCRNGRSPICARQVMPGNDRDGGFASHLVVPANGLCLVPGDPQDADASISSVAGLTLRHLAVVADAVSTPYQAIVRSGLAAGELAIVIGLGGVGGFAAQIAHDQGAIVVGLDVDPGRLRAARARGLALGIDPTVLTEKEVKAQIKAIAKEHGARDTCWKIFECSGTAAGQTLAWKLLVHGATVMVVGFTMESIPLRLSNLMAFDARALGNWGCAPEHYPEIVSRVLAGRIDVVGTTELRPLSSITDAFEAVHARRVDKRIVLAPDFEP